MKNILLFFSVLLSFQLSAQKYPIELKTEYFTIVGRQFHIDTVIDGRSVKSDSVGIVKIGLFDKIETAFVPGGVGPQIQKYLMNGLSKGKYTEAISIKITHFNIAEYSKGREFGRAEISLEFYKHKDSLMAKVFDCSSAIEEVSVNDNNSATHEKRVRAVVVDCMDKFNQSKWQTKDSLDYIKESDFFTSSSKDLSVLSVASEEKKIFEKDKRLVVTVGYLYGGVSLIGVDAEKLIAKRIGLQIGAGYKGFGAGINYHFSPVIDKSFLSLQYWHQGVDASYVQSSIGPSFNFRWHALAAQIGYAYVVDRGPGFKFVYPTNPSFLFAYSAGVFFTFK